MELSIRFQPVGTISARTLGVWTPPEKARLTLYSQLGDTLRFEVPLTSSKLGFQRFTLPASRNWKMTLEGLDNQDSLLYLGESDFYLAPNQNLVQRVELDPRFSVLTLVFPASSDLGRFRVELDGKVILDSAMNRTSGDSLAFFYPYLRASPQGIAHHFRLEAFGAGPDSSAKLSYSLDTAITVSSGAKIRYVWEMPWVASGVPPLGAFRLSLKAGLVGALTGTVEMAERFPWVIVTDPRDGLKYRTARVGGLNWFFQNLGSTCVGCDSVSRLFDPEEVDSACPPGWSVPDTSQWRALIEAVGGFDHLKSRTGWEEFSQAIYIGRYSMSAGDDAELANGDDSIGFSLSPTGMFVDSTTWTGWISRKMFLPFGQYLSRNRAIDYGDTVVVYLNLKASGSYFTENKAWVTSGTQVRAGAIRCVQP